MVVNSIELFRLRHRQPVGHRPQHILLDSRALGRLQVIVHAVVRDRSRHKPVRLVEALMKQLSRSLVLGKRMSAESRIQNCVLLEHVAHKSGVARIASDRVKDTGELHFAIILLVPLMRVAAGFTRLWNVGR